jgi:small multidrug resistance family-3 protein
MLDRLLVLRGGALFVLMIAATLEVSGDAFFQSAVHRTSGLSRWLSFVGGVVVLSLYGLVVNLPQWNFGKLLGIYVVFFFVVAQIVAKVRFHQPTTLPILVGGCMIVAGGAVISFWNV